MSTESETFEILQFKENGFSKRQWFIYTEYFCFSAWHKYNIYIYSLEAYHLTFRRCGGLTFFPPNQKTFFCPKQKSFFSDMENQYFFLKFYQNVLLKLFFVSFRLTIFLCNFNLATENKT